MNGNLMTDMVEKGMKLIKNQLKRKPSPYHIHNWGITSTTRFMSVSDYEHYKTNQEKLKKLKKVL